MLGFRVNVTTTDTPHETAGEVLPSPPFNAPVGFVGWSIFVLRLILDARVGSVWRAARRELPGWRGLVVDVGCGDSPWKRLLHPDASYVGLDVPHADSAFGYARGRGEQVTYDGVNFPFADARFSHVLCTEVLENVAPPKARYPVGGAAAVFSICFFERVAIGVPRRPLGVRLRSSQAHQDRPTPIEGELKLRVR